MSQSNAFKTQNNVKNMFAKLIIFTIIVQSLSLENNSGSEVCKELHTYCVDTEFSIPSLLNCVAKFSNDQLRSMTPTCQHFIWKKQTNLLLDGKYLNHVLQTDCTEQQRQKVLSCSNVLLTLWSCLVVNLNDRNDRGCLAAVTRVNALFSDYDTTKEFIVHCQDDVEKLKCGRINVDAQKSSQSSTLYCLQESKAKLSATCKESIVHLQWLREDLELFDVCVDDLSRFCPNERSGTNAAFKCLVKNKNLSNFSRRCREQITSRDREIAHDYRVSRGLAKACKDDIKQHHCRRGVSDEKQVRLAQILLCLESVSKNGTKISEECRIEIDDHRRMLMQDYQLSPEILTDCINDIFKFCGDVNNPETNEKKEIVHCLLEHATNKQNRDNHVTPQCQRSLEALIKVTDIGEDWRVDPVLRRACKPVVDFACKDTDGGDARVMSCLMEHINTPAMNPDCEHALLLIQYFVMRDFKLDPQLYRHCRDDAVKYCHAKKMWDDANNPEMDPERGPLILPCLHRIAYSDDNQVTLRKDCFKEVKRVMRLRANSVDLIPEVAEVCIEDLSVLCSGRTQRGAEMECLQINLESLQKTCKEAIIAYTEEEAANIELNPVIMSVCTEAMKNHCDHIWKGTKDKGDMMDCLISHKNDADLRQDLKCRAAIEHFQIISLKNYHFTYKFKQACRPYVVRFCAVSTTKNEVIACLSEVMRNETIRGQRHSIPKECRQQVKAQLYQQRESLVFDPKLANACKKEIEEFCGEQKGPGQAVECLTLNTARLGNACHHAIFMIKKFELGDSATDYTLINTCKEMTYKFCGNTDSIHLLDCLKTYKDDPTFDPRCHLVVVNRMIEQNTDFRFNPNLQMACGKNIDRYCSDIVATAQPNEELNGKVIQCLKNKFRESKLDNKCAQEVIKILQEQALNYKLNPLLQNFCKSEIEVLCKPLQEEEHGLVEECLKTAFINQKIVNRDCKIEVATLIAEAKADIHVDPILQDACTVDLLRYCSNVKSGNGRKLKCLRVILKDQSKAMEEDCRLKLQRRIEMFRNADTVLAQPPENVQQLVHQVVASPARKFFIVLLMTAIGLVFIIGISLGRLTKRAMNTKRK